MAKATGTSSRGNILLDTSGKPFVADFGLALRERDVHKGPRYADTPASMSPEQGEEATNTSIVEWNSSPALFLAGIMGFALWHGQNLHALAEEDK